MSGVMTAKRKLQFRCGRSVTIGIRDRGAKVVRHVDCNRFVRTTRVLALLAVILLFPISALGSSYFSGKFLEARCGGPCATTFDDGTRFITGKFYSVFDIRISGRDARIGIITERGNRAYVDYTDRCTGFFCSKPTPATFLDTINHWDVAGHRAAPYKPGDFPAAYYRASLRLLGHPVGFAASVLLAMVLFFLDRAGRAVLGVDSIPFAPVLIGFVFSLCFISGLDVPAQDEQFREINTYLDSRRTSPPYFYPLDYLPEVKNFEAYYAAVLPFVLLHFTFLAHVFWRRSEIVHGFYYYAVRDARKKIVEAAIDGDLSLRGNISRPVRRRWFANTAVMAASAHKLAEKLRADEEKQKAATKAMERETELLEAALRRERTRQARKFIESRRDDHG